jgi:hypothetical protein
MADAKRAKVYDYDSGKVRDALVSLFKRDRDEATVADLVASTGLPEHQVATEIKAVSDEYGARLKVTESGEILYSFPDGMRSRYRGFSHSLKRFLKGAKEAVKKVAALLFKAWIAVMLVGYFVLFLALLVLAFVASAAGSGKDSKSSRSRSSGGGVFVGRIFELFLRIWIYGEMFKDKDKIDRSNRKKRPMHTTVFSFVFGDGDPNPDWEAVERRAVLAYLRGNRGTIALEEFMAITGLSPRDAESKINRYMLEFSGSPEVSDGGVIYYSFPNVMAIGDRDAARWTGYPSRRRWAFSSNEGKTNVALAAVNGFNLVMGSYFAWAATAFGAYLPQRGIGLVYGFVGMLLGELGVRDPSVAIAVALGAVPLAFSLLFWLVPLVRSFTQRSLNRRIDEANGRAAAYRAIWADPIRVGAGHPALSNGAATQAIRELAAFEAADPNAADPDALDFAAIARAKAEIAKVRAGIDPSKFAVGETIFDSHA